MNNIEILLNLVKDVEKWGKKADTVNIALLPDKDDMFKIIDYCNAVTDLTEYIKEIKKELEEFVPEKEVVICSAIRTPSGFIFRGERHNDCIRTASQVQALTKFEVFEAKQGFITSKNRFVDRKEARKIQADAGIPSANTIGYYDKDELFSEDLY